MHEHAIVEEIVMQARKKLNGKEPKRIVLELGEIAELTEEELRQALKREVRWEIEIDKKNSSVECPCGYKGRAMVAERGHGFILINCSKCGKFNPKILEGKDLLLKKVE
ncbi:MAG: hydrogenase/urease maturation nickel metallochaperone HypA [Candidatus Diapherotrites archaeon]